MVKVSPLLELVQDWAAFLGQEMPKRQMEEFRLRERTGRPLGSNVFLATLERLIGRVLLPRKPGPKPKNPQS